MPAITAKATSATLSADATQYGQIIPVTCDEYGRIRVVPVSSDLYNYFAAGETLVPIGVEVPDFAGGTGIGAPWVCILGNKTGTFNFAPIVMDATGKLILSQTSSIPICGSITSGGYIPVVVTNSGGSAVEVLEGAEAGHYYLGTAIIQDVHADTNNSSPALFQLDGTNTYTFTGSATSTLGVAGIQITLRANQNCNVYVDQSPEGTNWDIVDQYTYVANSSFGITVQAVNSYYRVRVIGIATTTTFRLQSCLCPVVEALPRSLDYRGYLKTALAGDIYGNGPSLFTPNQELMTSERVRLIGAQAGSLTTVDSQFWNTSVSTGTVTVSAGEFVLTSGTANGHYARLYSKRVARFVSGATNKFRCHVRLDDTGTTDVKRRWGVAWGSTMPTITDGAYFELNGTTFSIVTLRDSVETRVSAGSFNGDLGITYSPTTNNTVMEITMMNGGVHFVIGGVLLHKVTATTAPWANTLSQYIWCDVSNSGNSAAVKIFFRTLNISRLGQLQTQPTSYYHAAATTSTPVILKTGAGNLHGIAINSVTQNANMTLWDSATTSANPIWTTGSMGSQTTPFHIDLHDIPFFNGLAFTVLAANAGATIMYE